MKYIDFHCDTITELHDHPEKGSLLKNSLYVDLEKLKKGGCFIQDFALWVDKKETPDVWKRYEDLLGTFRREMETWHRLICPIRCREDLREAEPLGPKHMAQALVIAPCTGTTMALLAAGISATPVTLAAKSMLRGGRPVVIGVSTNDGLSGSVGALAALLQRKNYYFIPFGQDDSYKKPCSLKADFTQLPDTLEAALRGVQLQPILL